MQKKLLVLLVAFLVLLVGARATEAAFPAMTSWASVRKAVPPAVVADTGGIDCAAKGMVVLDAGSGRVLAAKDAQKRLPMASTTKIMTALLTLEQEKLDEEFIVDAKAIRVEGSSMGLREGDTVTLRTLCYGMLLPSGNDAANAAAVRIAGSMEAFGELMNARAAELGMRDTHFVTPSGLHDEAHYSTAYDMALLARAALENPDFAAICGQSTARVRFGAPPYDRWLKNHNRLLREYPGTIGVKTGFTDAAGRCLVSSAERDGLRLVTVTLACPDDWTVHRRLYDTLFERFSPVSPDATALSVTVPVAGGGRTVVEAAYPGTATVGLLPGEQLRVEAAVQPFLFAPVREGQVAGTISLYAGDTLAANLPLVVRADVGARPVKERGFWDRLFGANRQSQDQVGSGGLWGAP